MHGNIHEGDRRRGRHVRPWLCISGKSVVASRVDRAGSGRDQKEKYKAMDTAGDSGDGENTNEKAAESQKVDFEDLIKKCAVVQLGERLRRKGKPRRGRVAGSNPARTLPGPMPGSFQGMAFCCGSNA